MLLVLLPYASSSHLTSVSLESRGLSLACFYIIVRNVSICNLARRAKANKFPKTTKNSPYDDRVTVETLLKSKNRHTVGGSTRQQEWGRKWRIVLGVIEAIAGIAPEGDQSVLAGIYSLAVLIPAIAVSVRRLHDTNHSRTVVAYRPCSAHRPYYSSRVHGPGQSAG